MYPVDWQLPGVAAPSQNSISLLPPTSNTSDVDVALNESAPLITKTGLEPVDENPFELSSWKDQELMSEEVRYPVSPFVVISPVTVWELMSKLTSYDVKN